MSFKSGLAIGFGAGYVLGAKAGRQRYEQIRGLWNQVSGSPTVQRAVDRTAGLAGEQGKRAVSVVQQGVAKASGTVKERLSKGERTGPETWPSGTGPDAVEGQLT
jgi:hypothetical protein